MAELSGPVEIAVIAFPGSQFNGEIAPALADLVDREVVQILDLLVVSKGENGDIVTLEVTELDDDPFADVDGEVGGLLSDEDIAAAGELLEPGTTAALIVWENTWARSLITAIARSGGYLVAHDRLDAETVNLALASLEAEEV